MELEEFAPLEPGTYFIDPDPFHPPPGVYEIPWRDGRCVTGASPRASEGRRVRIRDPPPLAFSSLPN
jgi:hypothetical protein